MARFLFRAEREGQLGRFLTVRFLAFPYYFFNNIGFNLPGIWGSVFLKDLPKTKKKTLAAKSAASRPISPIFP